MNPADTDIERLTQVLDSSDPKFSLACQALANQMTRLVLAQVVKGEETTREIAEVLAVAPQKVNYHILKLEKAGFIEKRGVFSGLRGRRSTRYVARNIALVLVPSEVWENKKELLRILRRKAKRALMTRLALSSIVALTSTLLIYMIGWSSTSQESGYYLLEETRNHILPWATGAAAFLTSWLVTRRVRM